MTGGRGQSNLSTSNNASHLELLNLTKQSLACVLYLKYVYCSNEHNCIVMWVQKERINIICFRILIPWATWAGQLGQRGWCIACIRVHAVQAVYTVYTVYTRLIVYIRCHLHTLETVYVLCTQHTLYAGYILCTVYAVYALYTLFTSFSWHNGRDPQRLNQNPL